MPVTRRSQTAQRARNRANRTPTPSPNNSPSPRPSPSPSSSSSSATQTSTRKTKGRAGKKSVRRRGTKRRGTKRRGTKRRRNRRRTTMRKNKGKNRRKTRRRIQRGGVPPLTMEEIINGGMISAAHIPKARMNGRKKEAKDVKSVDDLRSWNSGGQLLHQYGIKDATYYEDPRNDGYWWQDPTAILKEIAEYNQGRVEEAERIKGVDEVIRFEDQKKQELEDQEKKRQRESLKLYHGSLTKRSPKDAAGAATDEKRKRGNDDTWLGVETAGDSAAKRYGLAPPEKDPLAGVDLNKYTRSELDGYLRERLPPAKHHEFKGEKTSKPEKIRLLKQIIESIAHLNFTTIDKFPCAICFDKCETVVDGCFTLPCGHRFHRDCIKEYILSRGSPTQLPCPMCRKPFDINIINEWDEKAREVGLLPMNKFSAMKDSAVTVAARAAYAAAQQKSAAAADGAGGGGGGAGGAGAGSGAGGAGGGGPASSDD